MANDHYVSEFLTSRWEGRGRNLHFYDFEKARFDKRSSKNLFAKRDINAPETESFLNKNIESPVSNFLHRAIGDGKAAGVLKPSEDGKLFRALVGLMHLQVQRFDDAHSSRGGFDSTLNERVSSGTVYLDELAAITAEKESVLMVTLPGIEALFFGEMGYFVLPVVGGPPVRAVPLSPRHCFCIGPQGDAIHEQLIRLVNTDGMLSAFSVGVGRSPNRVVIPPQRFETLEEDPLALEKYILDMRDSATNVFNLIGQASAAVGLPTWTVSK